MSFISYSQNHEDVLLWRALKHVEHGFYVDVGANDPSDDSVTRSLYERGWSGINVEPLARHIRALQAQRPRDINLCVAVGAQEGEIEIFDTAVRGWATANADVARAHRANGVQVRASKVPLRRLDGILAEFAPAQVHFLKIDVEGFEEDVLRGMDFARWRPWVVVVEVTAPNSQLVNDRWAPLLTGAAYRCVFFDGLNQYYLADEHPELAPAFAVPPNVFDDFVSAEQVRLQQLVAHDESKLRELRKELEVRQRHVDSLAQQVALLQSELTGVYASRSWRLTQPLRAATLRLAALRQTVAVASTGINAAAPAVFADVVGLGGTRPASVEPFVYWNPLVLQQNPAPCLPAPAVAAPEAGGEQFWWRLVGHVEGHYSLAMVNRGLALGLQVLAPERVQMVAFHGQAYTPGHDFPAHESEPIGQLLACRVPAGVPVVSVVHHFPLVVDSAPADCRLAMFFWEESVVPEDMVAHLNAHFDAVLVASAFVRACLRNSGCQLAIFVVPLGLPAFARTAPLPAQAAAPAVGQNFRFLHVSSAFARKGVDVLMDAFYARFTQADAVELYIKAFANPHNQVADLVARYAGEHPNGPKVIVDETELSDAQMQALYASAHAMVLPTRGEGFNMPAAEALAMGLPLVVTGFGGQADFVNLQNAYLLPFSFAASQSHLQTDGSLWLEPDRLALAELLAMVRDDVLGQRGVLQERRLAVAHQVRAHYQWDRAALAVQQAAQGVLAGLPGARPAGKDLYALLSPWHTPCGIAEHAHALFRGWDKTALKVFCDARTAPDASQSVYAPCWSLGDSASVVAALDAIALKGFRVLVVQHQQSLFLLTEAVCAALARIRASGCVVVLELHSTLPLVRERRISTKAVKDLHTLDRILVHKLADVNYLLGIGLAHNVMCMPLGVTLPEATMPRHTARQQLGWAADDLVLGCFGFLLPHKGVDLVIGSMPGLGRATGKQVRLLAMTAVLDARSRQTLQDCQALAQSLGVADHIRWVTEFLPLEACLQELAAVDYMAYAYGPTRESASAAVTVGLATGAPVLVSRQPIFSDVDTCTHTLQADTCDGLVDAVAWLEQHPQERQSLRERQARWLALRDWSRLGRQFKASLQGLVLDRQTAATPCPMPLPELRQLFVDVSELYHRNARTGIQRVVLNILQAWLDAPPPGFVVQPVYGSENGELRYTNRFFTSRQQQGNGNDEQHVEAAWGDVFLGLDLSAHLFPAMEHPLQVLRLRGVKVCYVIYDIIALLRPDFSVPGMAATFEQWLHGLRRQSDQLVCISESVAQDVLLWLGGHTEEGSLPEVSYFHLGADLLRAEEIAPALAAPHPVIEQLQSQLSFLMVGTLEPRKGHRQVLQAFEWLWSQGSEARLVLVGKQGWLMDDFCLQLRQHPQFGQRVLWLEDAPDALLDALYSTCSCLLAASEMEGFGLPIIEAAQHGLPVIARDIAVFREVAQRHAFYFNGPEPETLGAALLAWSGLHDEGLAPDSSKMRWLTWQQSAAALFAAIR
ncbi:MAG: FkbM family methyltransferase [Polaromonas sp.]|nr:FkbM family methyltransferase [Polaromonas sp.]